MSDLKKLIEKVESGNVGSGLNASSVFGDTQAAMDAVDAFGGSLDAAKALHEALLPGWRWGRQWSRHMWVEANDMPGRSDRFYGEDPNSPARAWLLAILKAYQQEARP